MEDAVPVTTREDASSLPPAARIKPPRGPIAGYRFLVPILGILAGALALFLFVEPELRTRLFTFVGIYLLPGGIDYGIPVGIGVFEIPPAWVIAAVTYMDLWVTLFWVWNLDHLTRFSWIDERVAKSRHRTARLWDRFPRLRFATAPGLTLFILLPIPWTGSFVGVVAGKLIGLKDLELYLASIAGTFLRVITLTYGSAIIFALF